MKGIHLSLCLLFSSLLSAQKTYTDEIPALFRTGVYDLVKAEFYPSAGASDRQAHQQGLVTAGFEAKTFSEYANLFVAGECHVTEEGWQNWKANLGMHRPVILANFILENEGKVYCMTKYAMRYDDKEYLVSQAHKQINGKWYYLNLEENVDRLDLVMFFTTVREQFFIQWKKDRTVLKNDHVLFDGNGYLKATDLVKVYNARYTANHPSHSSLNLIFEDRIKSLTQRRSASEDALIAYFKDASLPAHETDYLLKLIAASQRGEAITHFSKLTNKPISQIFKECPNAAVK